MFGELCQASIRFSIFEVYLLLLSLYGFQGNGEKETSTKSVKRALLPHLFLAFTKRHILCIAKYILPFKPYFNLIGHNFLYDIKPNAFSKSMTATCSFF